MATDNSGSDTPALWITVVIFAHLFAFFFLYRAWMMTHPKSNCNVASSQSTAAKSESNEVSSVTENVHLQTTGSGGVLRTNSIDAGCGIGARSSLHSTAATNEKPISSALTTGTTTVIGGANELQRHEVVLSISNDHIPPAEYSNGNTVDDIDEDAPPPRASLVWQNLGCSYLTASGPRTVLQGAYGGVGPGDMMALLGPSGSGKTTLLDILSLRKTLGVLTGGISLNGKPYTKKACRHLMAYVPQYEVLPPMLTCEELMSYWSSLALPASMSRERRLLRAERVLAAVGLTAHIKTVVGGVLPGGLAVRGLSGGERKRLAVASGLLERPPLIFLDEPTTGLDSHSALTVMQHLKVMSSQGHTIVASIHQPRGAVWELFTQVLVVSSGHMIYSGAREGLVPWLTAEDGPLRYGPYCPARHGVAADWVMDLVNIGFRKPKRHFGRSMSSEDDLKNAASAFLKHFLSQREQHKQLRDTRQGSLADSHQHDAALPTAPASVHHAGWFRQVWVLSWRELLLITRNPTDVAGRSLLFCWIAVVIGVVFFPRGDALSRIRSSTSALVVEVMTLNLLPFIYMSLHSADKRFFIADVTSGLYRPSSYYTSKLLVSLPFAVLNSLTLILPLYGLAGLNMSRQAADWAPPLVEHSVVATLGYLVANQIIYLSALLTTNQDSAFMVAIGWTAINLLLSNTILRFSYMSMGWVSSLRFVSAMWYSFLGLIQAQFSHQNYSCASGLGSKTLVTQLLPELLPNLQVLQTSAIQQRMLQPGTSLDGCQVQGSMLVDYFGANEVSSHLACVALLLYLAVVHVASYAALRATLRRERR